MQQIRNQHFDDRVIIDRSVEYVNCTFKSAFIYITDVENLRVQFTNCIIRKCSIAYLSAQKKKVALETLCFLMTRMSDSYVLGIEVADVLISKSYITRCKFGTHADWVIVSETSMSSCVLRSKRFSKYSFEDCIVRSLHINAATISTFKAAYSKFYGLNLSNLYIMQFDLKMSSFRHLNFQDSILKLEYTFPEFEHTDLRSIKRSSVQTKATILKLKNELKQINRLLSAACRP